jgi:hypothetical protein
VEAITNERCAPREFPDFIMGVCSDRLTFWCFSKPNHPAHPGVIERWPTQVGDSWVMHEEGWSFAPDSKQQLFKDWLAQFQDLDRQMKEYIAARQKGRQPN